MTELPGIRYQSGGQPQGILPQHVATLEEKGWQRVDRPPAPPPTPEQLLAQREAMERASWRKLTAGAPMARVIPPPASSLMIEGRAYTSKSGAALDVPLEDARVLACNGWLLFGHSGALPARPAQPLKGEIFVETPAERVMQFDGVRWRDVHTGAVIP
ncbi:MAG: hypothetical protein WC943_17500 [Elusimicrobiota bacterium]